ncbi:MAG: YtxH domain-containing protein [Acidobacteria bacterium]|nr:YtxH domain-containing protein [Acidobacteriota bacterium]
MAEENKFAYFAFGFGLGLAIGVLFAPKSGEETRQYIRAKAGEGREFVKRRAEEIRESAGDAVERGKSALTRQREQLGAAIEAGRQAYREAVASDPAGASES